MVAIWRTPDATANSSGSVPSGRKVVAHTDTWLRSTDGVEGHDGDDRHVRTVDVDGDHRLVRGDRGGRVELAAVAAERPVLLDGVVGRTQVGAGATRLGGVDGADAELGVHGDEGLGHTLRVGAGGGGDLDRVDDRRHPRGTDLGGGAQPGVARVGGLGATGDESDGDRDDEREAQHQRCSTDDPHVCSSAGTADDISGIW